MPSVAQIVIQVDGKGAVDSMNQLNTSILKLDGNIQKIGRSGGSQSPFDRLTKDQEKAREAAQLLTNVTGVQMPRALEKVLASSKTIGPALAGAFNASVIASFAAAGGAAIIDLLEKVYSLRDALAQFHLEQFKSANDASISLLESQQTKSRELQVRGETATANELLKLQASYHTERLQLVEQSIAAEQQALQTGEYDVAKKVNDNLLALDRAHAAEKRAILLQESNDIQQANDQRVAATKVGLDRIGADEKTELDRIKGMVATGQTFWAVGEAQKTAVSAEATQKRRQYVQDEFDATRQLAGQAILSYMQGTAAINEQYKQQEEDLKTSLERGKILRETYDQRTLSDQIIRDNQLKELALKNAEDTKQALEDTALAQVPPWARAYAQIQVDAERELRKIQDDLDHTRISSEDAATKSAAVWQKEFAQTRDQLANDLEGLFDDITSGNIGQRFKKMFEDLVFRMVATWILGMTKMRAASSIGFGGGGGGILGTLLGGIFGGGGPGGTPPFQASFGADGGLLGNLPLGGAGVAAGLGFSSGTGTSGVGVTLPAGASTSSSGGAFGGIGGPLAGILGKVFSHGVTLPGLGPVSGTALATIGIGLLAGSFRQGGVLGALGGAAGGALTGFTIGGPIGAIVGGIAGLLLGIFGKSTKKARLQIEASVKAQSQVIEDAYDTYQVDAVDANQQLEDIRKQGVDALKQAGVKDISSIRVGHVDHWVDLAEKDIQSTQVERDRRSAIVFGPAQFHTGGLVGPELALLSPGISGRPAYHSGGEVNANLLVGEGVLNRGAMSKIGENGLNLINGGGSLGGHTFIMQVTAVDSASFMQMLNAGGGKAIKQWIAQAIQEGSWSR